MGRLRNICGTKTTLTCSHLVLWNNLFVSKYIFQLVLHRINCNIWTNFHTLCESLAHTESQIISKHSSGLKKAAK